MNEKPPTNMPFLIKPAPPKKLPPPPTPVSPAMWLVVVVLFVASLAVLMRVVAELRSRPLPAQPLYLITPILLPPPTSTATRQSTPTLAPTATASPSVTSTPTPTPTSTNTPLPASPTPAFSTVPATALAMEVVSENPLANWNNNFQLPVLPTPTPMPPVSLPPLETHWQAYVVSGLVAVNWFLAAVAFLMWRAGKPTITPPPMVVSVPAGERVERVVGRNDRNLPIREIVAVAAPPTLPASSLPITGDAPSITSDSDTNTSDDHTITSDTPPVTSDSDTNTNGASPLPPVALPIVPARPLVGEEVFYVQELAKNGVGKNKLCHIFFGAKNARRMAFITAALQQNG